MKETVIDLLRQYDSDNACVAQLLCDRHPADRLAFRVVDRSGGIRDLTFGELSDRSRRLATVLQQRGVEREDRIPVLMHKSVGLVVTLLAIWRLGAVHVPLFTAFSHGAVASRVGRSAAKLAVVAADQHFKFDGVEGLDVLVVDGDLEAAVEDAEGLADEVSVGGAGAMLQLFTSGTTGSPKAVVVPVRALASFHSYLVHGMDVRDDDVLWNMADPGWAYGLYCALLAPMAAGRANILSEAPFDAADTVRILRELEVTNFASAPTVYRALRQHGDTAGVRLRRACSAGEPLTPDVVEWAHQGLGVEVLDHYGQTEVGMIVANSAHTDLAAPPRPGSMGRALPGFEVDVVDGQIAVDVERSPLMWFTGYYGQADRTAERHTDDGKWYLTGDTGRVDNDGFVYFQARDDDVILAAGYRIGPMEIESVILGHPSVAEVAVVGQPDPDGMRGEIVAAFVVLAPGHHASDELAAELREHVRSTYSRHAYPRRVEFIDELPRTPSGKIQRFVLRAR